MSFQASLVLKSFKFDQLVGDIKNCSLDLSKAPFFHLFTPKTLYFKFIESKINTQAASIFFQTAIQSSRVNNWLIYHFSPVLINKNHNIKLFFSLFTHKLILKKYFFTLIQFCFIWIKISFFPTLWYQLSLDFAYINLIIIC